MRTVLLGSDFMYDKDGNLKPIEMNTAVGWDGPEKVEDDADCMDLASLDIFIKSNNFTAIHYIGNIPVLNTKLETYCIEKSITYEFHGVGNTAITIPYIEDNDQTLIIRSAYDTTALVDDHYCRDKVNFMNLIKESTFSSQFAYIDDNNTLVSNITTINDNGEHPNFILKSRYPGYDKVVYPKFFKVSTQSELDTIITNNVTTDYFLMEYLSNSSKVWEGHMMVLRTLNLLAPPNLESIQLGQYTKLNQNILLTGVTYDATTFEINAEFRDSYCTTEITNWLPKLLDTDLVEMADGSFKTAVELQIGDEIKTIAIPNDNGSNLDSYISQAFGLSYETLTSNAIYSNNIITNKGKVNTLTFLNELTFEDGDTWEDTMGSKYLTERNGLLKFESLFDIVAGDIIILLDTSSDNVSFVRKTIVSNIQRKRVFSGWFISVDTAAIFLTKTSNSSTTSYVSIEHNVGSCPPGACPPCSTRCASCPKQSPNCCDGSCTNAS